MAMNHLSLLRPLLCQSLVRHVRCPLAATTIRAPILLPNTTYYPAACARLYATKKAKGQWGGDHMWAASVSMNGGLLVLILFLLDMSFHSSFSPFFPPFSSSPKPRQRASQLRWILTRLWWKTSSIWVKWRRTWQLLSMHSKMTSHATSAFEPRQVFVLSRFVSFLPSCVFSLSESPHNPLL